MTTFPSSTRANMSENPITPGTVDAGPLLVEPSAYAVAARNKRGSVACKRCRRAKAKCLHSGAPPCRNCAETGYSTDCVFPEKGTSYEDRKPTRRPKRKLSKDGTDDGPAGGSKKGRNSTSTKSTELFSHEPMAIEPPRPQPSLSDTSYDDDEILPPPSILEEALEMFFTHISPCSILHKDALLGKIRAVPTTVEPMLILALCALLVRHSPGLRSFCIDNRWSTNYYAETARRQVYDCIEEPFLESAQAAYLLAMAEWSAGKGGQSWMMLGVAVRMALLLGLHREETHILPPQSIQEEIIRAEEGRRLLWTLYAADTCISLGIQKPRSIAATDITVSLPAEEAAFELIQLGPPVYRSHLRSTGSQGPINVSLMACLIISSEILGEAMQLAGDNSKHQASPNSPDSHFLGLQSAIVNLRRRLPPKYHYNRTNLQAAGPLNMTTNLILLHCTLASSEIIARRPYLSYIVRACTPDPSALGDLGVHSWWPSTPPQLFWMQCGQDMVLSALRNIDMIFELSSLPQNLHISSMLPPVLGFHLFLAALTLLYAWRCPSLCAERLAELPALIARAITLLKELISVLPMAQRWVNLLKHRLRPSVRVGHIIRADHAGDTLEGLLAHTSLETPLTPGLREASPGTPSADTLDPPRRQLAIYTPSASTPVVHQAPQSTSDPLQTLAFIASGCDRASQGMHGPPMLPLQMHHYPEIPSLDDALDQSLDNVLNYFPADSDASWSSAAPL